MSTNRSFEKRAREEVERIKAEETIEVERKQATMRELVEEARERREAEAAEQRRRNGERDAKLRRSQEEEKAEREEQLARDGAKRRWKASGGTEALFEQAWPSMWEEMLKERTVDADRGARQEMAQSRVSRI